jgi:hypothetical protein
VDEELAKLRKIWASRASARTFAPGVLAAMADLDPAAR